MLTTSSNNVLTPSNGGLPSLCARPSPILINERVLRKGGGGQGDGLWRPVIPKLTSLASRRQRLKLSARQKFRFR